MHPLPAFFFFRDFISSPQTSPAARTFHPVILRSNSSPTPNSPTIIEGRGNNHVAAASRIGITPAVTSTTFPPSSLPTSLPTPSSLRPPDQEQPPLPVLNDASTPGQALRGGPGTDWGTGSISSGRSALETPLAWRCGGGSGSEGEGEGNGVARNAQMNSRRIAGGAGGGGGANRGAFTRNLSAPLLGSLPFSLSNLVQIPSVAESTTTAQQAAPVASASAIAAPVTFSSTGGSAATARNTTGGGQPPSAARCGVESASSSEGRAAGKDNESAGADEGGGQAAAAPALNREIPVGASRTSAALVTGSVDGAASSRVMSPPAGASGVGCSVAAADVLGGRKDIASLRTVVHSSALSLSEVSATGPVVAGAERRHGGAQVDGMVDGDGDGGDDLDPRAGQDDPVRSSSTSRYPIGDVSIVGSGGALSYIMHPDHEESNRGDSGLNHRRPLRER